MGSPVSKQLDMDFGHDLIDNGTSDDYYTPPFIFEALNVQFDMDVAAPPNGVPWIPAKRSLTIIEDGLTTEWLGRVWCNPPFSNASPWAKKLVFHNNGIALLPTSKSAWFHLVWEKASGVMDLSSNFKLFTRANGEAKPIFMPVMMFSFNEENREILINSGLGVVR